MSLGLAVDVLAPTGRFVGRVSAGAPGLAGDAVGDAFDAALASGEGEVVELDAAAVVSVVAVGDVVALVAGNVGAATEPCAETGPRGSLDGRIAMNNTPAAIIASKPAIASVLPRFDGCAAPVIIALRDASVEVRLPALPIDISDVRPPTDGTATAYEPLEVFPGFDAIIPRIRSAESRDDKIVMQFDRSFANSATS